MRATTSAAIEAATLFCLGYLLVVYALYALMIVFAALESLVRVEERRHDDFAMLEASPFTPPVTVVAPVYNEEPVVAAVVDALLRMRYAEWELLLVNDGSTDGTMDVLREKLALEAYHVFGRTIVETEPVTVVYRSALHPHVRVIDKQNGGKADALNCGLNFARYRYVCTVDGDTIYSPDALLHGMRVAARDPARVIGVTSHIGVAVAPETWDGNGVEALDSTLLSNFQHLEYLRSFFNNRLAWSRFNIVLCSPGAFSLWRRDVLEEVGGFSRDFTCEDVEMTFRIHELYLRERRPYRIVSLPELVAKTEVPDRMATLVRQRSRWQRANLEAMWTYRRMLARPRYGLVGSLGFPVYLISEAFSPIAELLALLTLGAGAAAGVVSWPAYALFVGTLCFANGVLTVVAILLEDVNTRAYRLRHLARLILISPFELVLYRPLIMWSRMQGTVGFLRGERHWGKFDRNARAVEARPA